MFVEDSRREVTSAPCTVDAKRKTNKKKRKREKYKRGEVKK